MHLDLMFDISDSRNSVQSQSAEARYELDLDDVKLRVLN